MNFNLEIERNRCQSILYIERMIYTKLIYIRNKYTLSHKFLPCILVTPFVYTDITMHFPSIVDENIFSDNPYFTLMCNKNKIRDLKIESLFCNKFFDENDYIYNLYIKFI